MTIYRPAEDIAKQNATAEQIANEQYSPTLTIIFEEDLWSITAMDVLVAQFPANQYHKVNGYVAEYTHALYNAEAEAVRPHPEQQHPQLADALDAKPELTVHSSNPDQQDPGADRRGHGVPGYDPDGDALETLEDVRPPLPNRLDKPDFGSTHVADISDYVPGYDPND